MMDFLGKNDGAFFESYLAILVFVAAINYPQMERSAK
jgi:hypothetical protein